MKKISIIIICLFLNSFFFASTIFFSDTYMPHKVQEILMNDRIWSIKEVYGQKVHGEIDKAELIFNNENRISGCTGCNRIMGSYMLDKENKISFKNTATTMMNCVDYPFEQLILKALVQVESYKIESNILSLFNNEKQVILFLESGK